MSIEELNVELSYLRQRISAIGGHGPLATALRNEIAIVIRERNARSRQVLVNQDLDPCFAIAYASLIEDARSHNATLLEYLQEQLPCVGCRPTSACAPVQRMS
jgi:type II secretory pathway component PulM